MWHTQFQFLLKQCWVQFLSFAAKRGPATTRTHHTILSHCRVYEESTSFQSAQASCCPKSSNPLGLFSSPNGNGPDVVSLGADNRSDSCISGLGLLIQIPITVSGAMRETPVLQLESPTCWFPEDGQEREHTFRSSLLKSDKFYPRPWPPKQKDVP